MLLAFVFVIIKPEFALKHQVDISRSLCLFNKKLLQVVYL